MFVDLAASTKTTADYSCLGTLGLTHEADLVIMNMIRGKWEWPDTRRMIVTEVLRQRVPTLGVESVAFQLAAVQDLRRIPELIGVTILEVPIDRDKVSRALPVAARAEAGQLYMVQGDWNEALIQEFLQFPYATHDDQVDTVSGGVAMLAKYAGIVQPEVLTTLGDW
jgi:predicted phage terminase large subunit-like protein